MKTSTIIEYIKLLGMTLVYTIGQAFAFGIVLPLWAILIQLKGGDGK